MVTYILATAVSVLLFVGDRVTKIFIDNSMTLGEVKPFIPKLFNLYYVHNNGGAWGILAGYTWVLLTVTAIIMILGITVLICKGCKNSWLFWAVSLILSGGLGNMYDRIFNSGRVIDFIQFDFWKTFPIFNIADCAIVAGCCVLVVYFILDSIRENKTRKEAVNDGK